MRGRCGPNREAAAELLVSDPRQPSAGAARHFSAPGELAKRLAGLDLVWALGGNSFVLARAMTQAGFRDALREQQPRPEFTYGGYSAGACVAGPDLQGIDLMDDPAVLPEGYPPATEPECLRLLPYRIAPHWRSEHPETEGAERTAAYLAGKGLAHRCLRDGEAVHVGPGGDEFSAR